ncbi:MAG: hypothetical protein KA140_03480 [Caldisericia bacterium]|nr:hypothetical protein [Caldisericia bacterium]
MKKTIILAGVMVLVLSTVQMSSGYDAATLDSPFGMHPASMSYSQQDARSFQAAQLMNVGWHRPHVYAFQFLIQKDIKKPEYDFKMHDNLYGKVPAGLRIIANITADIADERSNGYFKKNTYLPVDEDAYSAFVKAVVERYDGDGVDDMPGLTNPIKHWQVDNEPPRKRTGYTKLLELTYNAVKQADPECKVLIGGATGFPNDLVKNFNRDFVPMLKELNGKYFDIFDFHWYGSLKEYAGCKSACQVIRKALDENGFSNAPIWITEMGAYSGKPQRGPGKFDFQSESDQANDIFRKLIHPLSYGVAKIFPAFGMIEGFVDPKDNDYFDNTGLIFDGIGQYDKGRGVKKLSFWTYKLVAENLGGADLSKVETLTDKDGVMVIKFMVSGKPVYVCWYDWWTGKDKTKKVTIKLSNGKWNIYEAIPNKDSGKNVKDTDYPKFFTSTTKTVSNGKLELTLGTKPLIVRQ